MLSFWTWYICSSFSRNLLRVFGRNTESTQWFLILDSSNPVSVQQRCNRNIVYELSPKVESAAFEVVATAHHFQTHVSLFHVSRLPDCNIHWMRVNVFRSLRLFDFLGFFVFSLFVVVVVVVVVFLVVLFLSPFINIASYSISLPLLSHLARSLSAVHVVPSSITFKSLYINLVGKIRLKRTIFSNSHLMRIFSCNETVSHLFFTSLFLSIALRSLTGVCIFSSPYRFSRVSMSIFCL